MNRKETTEFLSHLLESKVLYPFGKHWASEVVLNFGREDLRRVDYLLFEPAGATYISDIEKGIFTAYEIKSCKDDVYSGNGLNFVGEKNYIVTTMQCWKDLQEDYLINYKLENHIDTFNKRHITNWGVLVAVPESMNVRSTKELHDEYKNPTELSQNIRWKFFDIKECLPGKRTKSMTELLFCMLRSKGHPYLENDYLFLKNKVITLEKQIKENWLYQENKRLEEMIDMYKKDIAELAEENMRLSDGKI